MRRLPVELPLVGRDEELEILDGFDAGGRRQFVIGGAAGVGKSRLLAEYVGRRQESGATAVVIRATVSTASIPFGAFARWIPPGISSGGDRLEILRAISSALAPPDETVTIGVDDAHLLDGGSAALCLDLAQRTGVVLAATVRTGEPAPDAVTALWKDGLAERIDVQPLSELETRLLVIAILGGTVSEDLRHRIWRLTEGVPLYIREVVAAGLEREVIRYDGVRWLWTGALSGSDRLRSLIHSRVEHLDEAGRHVLDVLAIGEPLAVGALADVTDSGTVQALESSGHIVVDTRTEGDVARLCHPLYGEVIRGEMPVVARRRACADLVDATRRSGFAETDLLRVAMWHVDSDQEPDVDLLLAAIERAFAVHDWVLTDRLAKAAEAGGVGDRATLLLALSSAALARWDDAEARLASLDPLLVDDDLALRWATIRAWVDFFHHGDGDAALAALATMQPRSEPAAAGATAQAAVLAFFMADVSEMERQINRVRSIERAGHGPKLLAEVIEAMRLTFVGRREAARAVVDAAMGPAIARADSDPSVTAILAYAHFHGLVLDGDLDDAAAFAEGIHTLTTGKLPSLRALSLTYVAYAELFRGNLQRALALAQEAADGSGDRDIFARRLWIAGVIASASAQLGDAETAEAAIGWARSRWPIVRMYQLHIDFAAAWAADARGQTKRSQTLIEGVADEARAHGLVMIELFAYHDLVRLGAPQRAAPRLAELAETMHSPYPTAVADYAAAAASGNGDDLDDAARRFEEMGAKLHAAEAHAMAALAHRRDGRRGSHLTSVAAARRLLRSCVGARTPLVRTLDDTPLLATLTAREREVVSLAARQLTNRQIATELFISVRTVTTHLQHVYAKLGVSDRTQLAALTTEIPP